MDALAEDNCCEALLRSISSGLSPSPESTFPQGKLGESGQSAELLLWNEHVRGLDFPQQLHYNLLVLFAKMACKQNGGACDVVLAQLVFFGIVASQLANERQRVRIDICTFRRFEQKSRTSAIQWRRNSKNALCTSPPPFTDSVSDRSYWSPPQSPAGWQLPQRSPAPLEPSAKGRSFLGPKIKWVCLKMLCTPKPNG